MTSDLTTNGGTLMVYVAPAQPHSLFFWVSVAVIAVYVGVGAFAAYGEWRQ